MQFSLKRALKSKRNSSGFFSQSTQEQPFS
jgi:hypothetical protein